MQGRGPGPPNTTGKQVLVKSCRMCRCHHHESPEEITLLKISARPNLWFYHLKMYFLQRFRLSVLCFQICLYIMFILCWFAFLIFTTEARTFSRKVLCHRIRYSGIIIIMSHDK